MKKHVKGHPLQKTSRFNFCDTCDHWTSPASSLLLRRWKHPKKASTRELETGMLKAGLPNMLTPCPHTSSSAARLSQHCFPVFTFRVSPASRVSPTHTLNHTRGRCQGLQFHTGTIRIDHSSIYHRCVYPPVTRRVLLGTNSDILLVLLYPPRALYILGSH